MAIILALVALAGSTWALMKAIRMPRALEKKLKTLEAERDREWRWEGGSGCFSFGGTVQYIEESNIYLCFVVCRLKRGLVT